MTSAENPLLRVGELPRFDAITAAHVEPAIRELLPRQQAALDALEGAHAPTWDGLVVPLRRLAEPLSSAWGVVGHLISVKNAPELRQAHERAQPEVVAARMRIDQSEPLYRGLKRVLTEDRSLDSGRKRVVEQMVRDAELAGIGLQGAQRERFNALEIELSELATRYQNQLLDATKAFA
ncbi:MAG: M3 family peptidase, partial [Planctomycetes bacterium]|nr:M3 family peptidase [Planctomycetota bacterium]